MSNEADRIKAMRVKASELARSGTFVSWIEVEKALIQLGMVEARLEFSQPQTQKAIDDVCRIAQGARACGLTYDEALKRDRRR